jgi:hypothetical protein
VHDFQSPLRLDAESKNTMQIGTWHIGTKYFELAPVPESIKGFRFASWEDREGIDNVYTVARSAEHF